MRIAIGCDHRGLDLKKAVINDLSQMGHSYQDFGSFSDEAVDYPDIAQDVAQAAVGRDFDFGVLICYSGIGMSISANKVNGARAALCDYVKTAKLARQHNDANILCLAAMHRPQTALKILEAFLAAQFEGGRHQLRVDKISAIEGKCQ